MVVVVFGPDQWVEGKQIRRKTVDKLFINDYWIIRNMKRSPFLCIKETGFP